ncbi:MAG: thioredoxin 1 [Myxococcota bacterium]|jgi:thioredoxin 1
MASEHVITVSTDSFEANVINSDVPVVVDFWATWCGPCKRIAPMLDAAATDYDGKVRIAKVDVDQNRALAGKYGVQSIPTLIVFKNGEVAGKHVGMLNRAKLDTLIGI